jgi:hypothetical protein
MAVCKGVQRSGSNCDKVLASLCAQTFSRLKRLTLKNAVVERGSVDALRRDWVSSSSSFVVSVLESEGGRDLKNMKKNKNQFTLQLICCRLIGDVLGLGLIDPRFGIEDVYKGGH